MIGNIPYIKLIFTLQLLEDTELPAAKTSALRGGMGEMMLRQNCVQNRDCSPCEFQPACVVWDAFYSRPKGKPDFVTGKESVGYLIECMNTRTLFEKGDLLKFNLILFGESISFFSIYLQAITYLGMIGLGKNNSHYQVYEVKNTRGGLILSQGRVDMSEYRIDRIGEYMTRRKRVLMQTAQKNSSEEGAIHPVNPESGAAMEIKEKNRNYQLTFLTPLNMKYQGEYMREFVSEALVQGAVRRLKMLGAYTGQMEDESELPDPTEYPLIERQETAYDERYRYSSTQDKRMRMPGIRGQVWFANMPEECLEYLIAGELLHIGKNSSFGYGKYRLDVRN